MTTAVLEKTQTKFEIIGKNLEPLNLNFMRYALNYQN